VRFSVSFLGVAVLLVLLAGIGRVQLRLAAQEPAPAGQSQPAAQTADGAKTEAAKPEEDENAKFLYGPLVQSTAKATNLPVKTVSVGYQFINFAIIALAIVVPLVRIMPKFLKNRAAKVREDIDSAKKVTEDANARLSAVEAKLASIGEEIAKFRAEVERESLQDEARIKSTIEEESARIVAAAEQEIGVAAAQARRTLRHFAADLAIDQAAKQLVLTPETDRALIAEFVGDVAKGGLN
jgi:F-type H+-transporting ATPase subunit b